MTSLKKLTLSLFVSTALLVTAIPSAMAVGKIENKSPAETVIDIDETVELSQQVLEAVKSGELEKVEMMKMFKSLKQSAKKIESAVTYSIREKALGRLGKARLAYKKGKDQAEVEEKMTKANDTFIELKNRYHNFGGD